MTTVLVTGGAGFIGSNFIRFVLAETDLHVVNLDRLTYAGNLENLHDVQHSPRYHFCLGSITDADCVRELLVHHRPRFVVNLAAETHVDRALQDASPFVETNIRGTLVLLDAVRELDAVRLVQVSTDEVYGSLEGDFRATEDTPLNPTNPYAATKAAADLLVTSWCQSFGVDAVITRATNTYGPYQFPEKLIPLMICNADAGEPIPIYGDGGQVRSWIHVRDHCRALLSILEGGQAGRMYHISAGDELPNLELVQRLLKKMDRSSDLVRHVADRPAHDRRYALATDRLREELRWTPEVPLDEGLTETIAWYRSHPEWVAHVRSGAYRTYYETQYGERLRGADQGSSASLKPGS